MQKKKLSTCLAVGAVCGAVVVSLLVGIVAVGNDFRFTRSSVSIPGPSGNLDGVVTRPSDGAVRGLVVMVHGDGPVDATMNDLYAPWFEGAADAGFATLSWSKPGVGGSEGNWLTQSMNDRAAEVSSALDWAEQQKEIETDTIVLWGASQAGWVLPKVVSARDDIDAVVAVGTAINWLRQGRFNLLAELDDEHADARMRENAIESSDRDRDLLVDGASYEQYLAVTNDSEPMTEDRWGFVKKNYAADATADMETSASKQIPVHLVVGTHDRNVDVAETESGYRAIYGPLLTVTHVDGSHSLARTLIEESDTVGTATAIVWPRALLASGTIDDYRTVLRSFRH